MKKWMTLLFFVCASLLHSEIIETQHFRDVPAHVKEGTLLILDIDDTLLITKQMLGCDEWFNYRRKQHQDAGLSSLQALEKALAEWEAIRHLSKMEIVETGTEKIISDLQKKGFCVMGLTTQGLSLATRTVGQLAEQNIDLSLTAPSKEEHLLSINGHGALYRKGILFTSGTHKGEALFQLCKAIGYEPKRIVFVNDKASHLAEIENTANKRNVPFVGLRYAFSDARKAAFKSDVAEFQFQHSTFTHLLSDDEAKTLINLRDCR